MKTISLTQPWASLVAAGAKRIETRSWRTEYRGPLAIHAAKGMPGWAEQACYEEPFFSVLRAAGLIDHRPATATLPRGVVLATVTLVDCLSITAGPVRGQRTLALDEEGIVRDWCWAEWNGFAMHTGIGQNFGEHEAAFGDYSPGRYGWLLSDVRPLPTPIPAKGALGLWEWDQDAVAVPAERPSAARLF